jgi:hypothetical protein
LRSCLFSHNLGSVKAPRHWAPSRFFF